MKIESVRIQNFRCFEDEIVVLNDYTCLVGANGCGKSTVLTALRVFFRDQAGSPTELLTLQPQDFCRTDTSKDVTITVTFLDLESDAMEDFKNYVRHGKLVVSAVASWSEPAQRAEVKQYGERMVFRPFSPFFKAEGDKASVADLKAIYTQLRSSFHDLPASGTKAEMIAALQSYEAGHQELCTLERSEDEFYGFTKGSRLKKYVEWVFIPAVKDASTEQIDVKKSALNLLLERTVRSKMSFDETLRQIRTSAAEQYSQMLAHQQSALGELSESLTRRLRDWAHPDAALAVRWRDDPTRNISIQEPQAEVSALDGSLELSISRMGHGMQRSFLLALLQELSGCQNTGGPRLLLACEEPELYQHPPQARHLSSVLQKLSQSNTQVLVSTHSPFFVSGRGFPDVRLFRRGSIDEQPCVRSLSFEQFSRSLRELVGHAPAPNAVELKLEQILQPALREMFFAPVLVLVEGPEDFGYVGTYFELSDRQDEFRRLGCHIVPTEGKGQMIYTLAVARELEIPTFIVFDADGDETREDARAQNERNNTALLRLCDVASPEPFPNGVFTTRSLVMWPTKIARAVQEDFGAAEWARQEQVVRERRGLRGLENASKNAVFIGLVLKELYEAGARSRKLEFLCDRIIDFARTERSVGLTAGLVSELGNAPST